MFRRSLRLPISTTRSCKSLQVEFSAKTAEIPPTFQRRFLKWEYGSSNPPRSANQSLNYRLLGGESDKRPPIGAFCELAMCLYTPKLNNLGAKSPIVSGPDRKYSRFWETRAGDRARSARRGVGRSLAQGIVPSEQTAHRHERPPISLHEVLGCCILVWAIERPTSIASLS